MPNSTEWKRTHQSHWSQPNGMPWKKCRCGNDGKYKLDRWYCEECWQQGDDEEKPTGESNLNE